MGCVHRRYSQTPPSPKPSTQVNRDPMAWGLPVMACRGLLRVDATQAEQPSRNPQGSCPLGQRWIPAGSSSNTAASTAPHRHRRQPGVERPGRPCPWLQCRRTRQRPEWGVRSVVRPFGAWGGCGSCGKATTGPARRRAVHGRTCSGIAAAANSPSDGGDAHAGSVGDAPEAWESLTESYRFQSRSLQLVASLRRRSPDTPNT